MSYADDIFKRNCLDILENGTDTKGEEVRPHWEDGDRAYTLKRFGVVNRYDLRKEFPVLTLRRVPLKSALDEILWIYQKKSNNVNDLKSHIWDAWADVSGSIGSAYGYQIANKYIYNDIDRKKLQNVIDGRCINKCSYWKGQRCIATRNNWGEWRMDQMDKVLYDLKTTPFSRRIMTTMWNPKEQHEMALAPCAYSMTYNVTEEGGHLVLNGLLNQRSQDMLVASGWNTAQYALLLMMIAQVCNMIPGELVHVIADCHIYDRHIPLVKELLECETYSAPTVSFKESIKDFYDFTVDDLIIKDYLYSPWNKKIPVAI